MHCVASRAVTLALALVLAGCGAGAGTSPAASGAGAPAATEAVLAADPGSSGAAPGDGGAAGSVVIPDDAVGRVAYTADTSATSTVEYVPGGGPVSVSATDGAGAKWTLDIPDGALAWPATFSMTPLATIDAELPGPVAGGVLLEPQGSVFAIPVSISVSGGAGILQGDDAGDVRIATPGDNGWGTAVLQHFSPVLSFTPDDPVWLPSVREAAEAHGKAYTAAKELLKTKVGDIPRAPSIPWECRDNDAWAKEADKVGKFAEAFLAPEGPLFTQLLASKTIAARAGLAIDETYEVERQLLQRLATKSGNLLDATRGQPDKILPVLMIVTRVASDIALMGDDAQALMQRIAAWLEASIDPVVKAIRQDHDYAQAAVVWHVGQTAARWGASGNMFDKVYAKLETALRFKARLRFQWNATQEPTERTVTGGTIPLSYSLALGTPTVFGEGLVDYEDYRHEQGLKLEAPSFLVQVAIKDVDFCANKAILLVDRMGGPDEVRIDPQGTRIPFDFMMYGFGAFYDKYSADRPVAWPVPVDSLFGFPVELHNKKVTWIDESFDEQKGSDKGSFEVTVEHAPAG